jgi:hypothetical protein
MSRRRVDRTDRNGDPLDGVVNLFDVAIVLAVAFLLAALAGIGLSEVLSNESVTLVKNPGEANMEVIVRDGDTITKMQLSGGQEITGMGSLVGQFYRLEDGTTVYVPITEPARPGVTPTTAGGAPGSGGTRLMPPTTTTP